MHLGAPGTDKVRNVVLVGHGGAGKTSLAEAMLYLSGATKRLGTVDDGHSGLDYEPEEIKRQFSINLSLAPVVHDGVKINIIDTPGYADFVGDAIAGMEAAEMALFVVDAVSGPQVQTARLWKIAGDMGIARAVFVNRMDKEHADFEAVMAALDAKFGHRVGAVQIPMGAESSFRGVIDIIRMKAYHHEGDKEEVLDIPAEFMAAAESRPRQAHRPRRRGRREPSWRSISRARRLNQAELEALLDQAIAQGIFIPVFVGSATKLQGIEDLMDEIVSFFPEPTAHGPVPTADGGEVRIDTEGAVSGLVFKTIFDPYVGRLNFVKVLSGELKPGSELINARTGKKERVAHVLKMVGKETSDIASAPAGDVVVLPKLGDVITGDTLSEKGDVVIAPLPLPEPLYPVAVVAKTKADEDKLGTAINKLVEEEPTLRLKRDDETHQTVLSTLGETAVAVALAKLKDRYNAEAELVDLRIPYRETIRKSATAQGRHKKQTGGSGQFADCWLRVDPNHGQGYEFKDEIVGGKISKPYIVAIDKGVQNAMTEGVLAGYPMVDVKVAVFDGSMHAVDSNEMAFRTAARIGFRAATEKADMVLLEPVATLLIDAPEDYSGAIMGDMSSRRGRILGMEMVDGMQRIKAVVPYAEVVHYSPILRSVTHGTGMYSLEIGEYAEVPHDMAQKVIDEYLKHKAEGH